MINYGAIRAAVQKQLQDYLNNEYPGGVSVRVEPPEFGTSGQPEVAVYLMRETNERVQVSGADPYQTILVFMLMASLYSVVSAEDAINKRDEMVNHIRTAVKADVSFAGAVDFSSIGEVDHEPAISEGGYYAGCRITLNAHVQA